MAYSTIGLTVRAYLTLPDGSISKLDCTYFTSTFELNAIPTCSFGVPLGRLASAPGQISNIHFVINDLKLVTAVTVTLQITPGASDSPRDEWPATEFVIFDGFATSCGFRKDFGSADFMIHCTHWLCDLDFASAFSRSSHPLNPTEYTWQAVAPIRNTAGGIISVPSLTNLTRAYALFSDAVLADDFWASATDVLDEAGDILSSGGGLKAWFEDLSSEDRINIIEIGLASPNTTNFEALRALDRFEPIEAEGDYFYGVPLPLNQSLNTSADTAANGIMQHIGQQTALTFQGQTIWDKLIQFGNDFLYAVVPMVSRSLVVPFSPYLSSTYKTISAADYSYGEMGAPCIRPIRGIIVTGGRGTSPAGAFQNYNGVLGYYEGRPDGMVITTQAPPWLANVRPDSFSNGTTNIAGAGAIPTAITPTAGTTTRSAPLLTNTTSELQKLAGAYAKAKYFQEVLRPRQGVVSGKLRMDIAPGTLVMVEGSTEKFVRQIIGINGADQNLYGMVMRVTTVIDGADERSSGRAGTAYQLAFMRSQAEQDDLAYASPEHPLWDTIHLGSPLIDYVYKT